MLIKSGTKMSYVIGGIVQLMLAAACGFLLVPYALAGFGINIEGWLTSVDNLFSSDAGNTVKVVLNFLLPVMFVFNFIALFVRKSFASTFFKLSSLLPLFLFSCQALENAIFLLGVDNITFERFLGEGVVYPVLIASAICYALGFIFQFTVNRKNPRKANTFQMAKGLVWILLAGLNFLNLFTLPDWATTLVTISATDRLPYFFAWYFLLMGVWQCISSPRIIDSADLEFPTGYPQPYGQPVYPYGAPYQPQPPYPPYGPRQGLASEEEEAPGLNLEVPKETTKMGLAQESETTENEPLPPTLEMPRESVKENEPPILRPKENENLKSKENATSLDLSIPSEEPQKATIKTSKENLTPLRLPPKLPPKLAAKMGEKDKKDESDT